LANKNFVEATKVTHFVAIMMRKGGDSLTIMEVRGKNQGWRQKAEAMTNIIATFYDDVTKNGFLRTQGHAARWTEATLKTLGFHLDRGTKKAVAAALPEEMASSVTRVFWLLHFRQGDYTAAQFRKDVARRVGATDGQFAEKPILAVFAGIKRLIDSDLSDRIAKSLPEDISQKLWQKA